MPRYENDKLVLKLYIRLILYVINSYTNRKNISTYEEYLYNTFKELSLRNKLLHDGDKYMIDGPNAFDDSMVDIIQKKHKITSGDSETYQEAVPVPGPNSDTPPGPNSDTPPRPITRGKHILNQTPAPRRNPVRTARPPNKIYEAAASALSVSPPLDIRSIQQDNIDKKIESILSGTSTWQDVQKNMSAADFTLMYDKILQIRQRTTTDVPFIDNIIAEIAQYNSLKPTITVPIDPKDSKDPIDPKDSKDPKDPKDPIDSIDPIPFNRPPRTDGTISEATPGTILYIIDKITDTIALRPIYELIKDKSLNVKEDFLARVEQQYITDNDKIFDLKNIDVLKEFIAESIKNQQRIKRNHNISIFKEIFAENLLSTIPDIDIWYNTQHKEKQIINTIKAYISALRSIEDKSGSSLNKNLDIAIKTMPKYLNDDPVTRIFVKTILLSSGNKSKIASIKSNILNYYGTTDESLNKLIEDLTQILEDMLTIEEELKESKKSKKSKTTDTKKTFFPFKVKTPSGNVTLKKKGN